MKFDSTGMLMSFFEISVTILTAYKLNTEKKKHSAFDNAVSFFCLTGISLVYQYLQIQYQLFSLNSLGILLNYALRVGFTYVFFKVWSGRSKRVSLYSAMLLRTLFSTSTGFRRMPVITILDEHIFGSIKDPALRGALSSPLFTNLIYLLIVILFILFSGFERSSDPSGADLVILLTILVFQTISIEIFKDVFTVSTETPGNRVVLNSLFIFFLELFILLLTLLIIRSNNKRDENRRLAMEALKNSYEIEGLKMQMNSDQELRAFRHDVKNHLIALNCMASEEGKINKYIGNMIHDIEDAGLTFNTGNKLLDGIFSVKAAQIKEKGISFSADVIMEPAHFPAVSDNDLCIVFGNLLDNAVEACEKVQDEKYIRIIGHPQGAYYCVKFSNSYNGQLRSESGSLLTTKKNKDLHGFGLSNVERAVRRFGGIITFSHDDPRVFTTVVLFPDDTPDKEQEECVM